MTSGRQPAKPDARGPARPVDNPRAGFFHVRMVKGGPCVPARICHDFGQFWAVINGVTVDGGGEDPILVKDVMRIWHYGVEIDEAEYERRLLMERLDPLKPIDLRNKPSLF